MKRIICLAILAGSLALAVCAQPKPVVVDDYLKGQMAKLHIPGVAVAVLRSGELEMIKGYGVANIERRSKVTRNTRFQIASTTKPFTSMAVMMLVEEGRVRLDEKAAKYLPWLPPVYKDVTVRQLLSHTSGVNRDVRTGNVDNFTLEEFKKRFIAAPISFTPGERWEYSNNGFILLGMLVEAVSGQPYGEFLHDGIFRPLGMKHTRLMEPPIAADDRAVGYDWENEAYKPSPYYHGGYGAGGIVSSVADMAKWAKALDKGKLLKPSSYELIWTTTDLRNGRPVDFEFRGERSGYGFGWFLTFYRGHKLLTHGGTVSGFSGQIDRFANDKMTIIVLTNAKSGADRTGYAEVLANGIADLYFSTTSN
jgi:CubicO group peptidase (beta-lactamase class C family)